MLNHIIRYFFLILTIFAAGNVGIIDRSFPPYQLIGAFHAISWHTVGTFQAHPTVVGKHVACGVFYTGCRAFSVPLWLECRVVGYGQGLPKWWAHSRRWWNLISCGMCRYFLEQQAMTIGRCEHSYWWLEDRSNKNDHGFTINKLVGKILSSSLLFLSIARTALQILLRPRQAPKV